MNKKKILGWLKWTIIIYCFVGILIYYLQDYVMFQRVALPGSHRYDFKYSHREINIAFDKESSMNIVQFLAPDSSKKGVVLYFHGNKKNISWYAKYAPLFTGRQYEVWMIDYPGFGKSTGPLTEEILYAYALQLYKLARKQHEPENIIIYGKSMGTGIAANLASRQHCKALLLETPYYSLSSVGSHFFPIFPMEQMTKIKIPAYEFIGVVKDPILIFHGTNDWIIPLKNAKRLQPYLKPNDEFIIIAKGHHNNLSQSALFLNKLDSVLKD